MPASLRSDYPINNRDELAHFGPESSPIFAGIRIWI
jgi:hypothetical protein